MISKASLILIMANVVIGGIPISSYYGQSHASASILTQQPAYTLHQQYAPQPSYLTPTYQYYQPKPQVSAFQLQPAFIAKQPGAIVQAEARKIVLREPETADPNYSFAYAVNDEKTGDQKSHEETRKGDNVVGKYTVVEPDGTLRIVRYTAGKEGFNAIVERQPALTPAKPVTEPPQRQHIFAHFPVRQIIAQSQPIYYQPHTQVHATASASTAPASPYGNYYY